MLRGLTTAILLTLAVPGKGYAQANEKQAELARVGILSYSDQTQTERFSYLSGSIVAAVNKSMRKQFEYLKVDQKKLNDYTKKNPPAAKTYQKEELAAIAKSMPAEILIYGYYVFNKDSDQVEIVNQIYFSDGSELKTITPIRNKVDSTLFAATDRVAVEIVKEITELAKRQAAQKTEKPRGEDEKWQIFKYRGDAKSFAAKKNFFNLSLGPNFAGSGIEDSKPGGQLDLRYMRRWQDSSIFYGGSLLLYQLESGTDTTFSTSLGLGAASVLLGYQYLLSPRWRLVAQAGGGYYVGSIKSDFTSSTSGDTQTVLNETIHNPIAVAHIGTDYLFFKKFSLGFYLGTITIFDQTDTILRIPFYLNFTYSF